MTRTRNSEPVNRRVSKDNRRAVCRIRSNLSRQILLKPASSQASRVTNKTGRCVASKLVKIRAVSRKINRVVNKAASRAQSRADNLVGSLPASLIRKLDIPKDSRA